MSRVEPCLIHLSLLPILQHSTWNIMNEQACQRPDILVLCFISLYSIPHKFSPPIQLNCHTHGFTTIQGSFSSLKSFTCILLIYPNPTTSLGTSSNPPYSKLFLHPPQPTQAHHWIVLMIPIHLALGIPSCCSGKTKTQREKGLSQGDIACSVVELLPKLKSPVHESSP